MKLESNMTPERLKHLREAAVGSHLFSESTLAETLTAIESLQAENERLKKVISGYETQANDDCLMIFRLNAQLAALSAQEPVGECVEWPNDNERWGVTALINQKLLPEGTKLYLAAKPDTEALAKKDAALKACVDALELTQMVHEETSRNKVEAAITQAQEALK